MGRMIIWTCFEKVYALEEKWHIELEEFQFVVTNCIKVNIIDNSGCTLVVVQSKTCNILAKYSMLIRCKSSMSRLYRKWI